jgi:dTDP-L-rhamnose 4-epimerase
MSPRTLITGGAGFIGGHLATELLEAGHDVRILDSLVPQVHPGQERPDYLSKEVELLVGDVRDRAAVDKALEGMDQVVHLAARVGVGQSMYEIDEYTSANTGGTAVLLQAMLDHPVQRLVVASSMSIYGEGLYHDAAGSPVASALRRRSDLEVGCWEPSDGAGRPLTPVPTAENKAPTLTSVYALNKYDQERLTLLFGEAYRVPTAALRFFNVYGPYQALSNPYTGVLAIFASRLLNDRPPLIYEDGLQRRDFVSVHDVARACRLALESDRSGGQVINVGSGQSYTIREIGRRLAQTLDKEHVGVEVNGKYRIGDIRHCFADTSLAEELLGYRAHWGLEQGMAELAEWLEGQVAEDSVEKAAAELATRGLTV